MPGEYVVRWTGGRIGLGASVFHFQGTDSPSAAFAAANAIRNFFDAIKPNLPAGITITCDPEVKNLTAAGVLTSVVPFTAPATVNGTGAAGFANGVGAMVRWNTPSIVAGRRLLGRTYIVPLTSVSFTSGNLTPAAQTVVQGAASALLSAMTSNGTVLQVWSKAHATTADVNSSQVPSRPSTLRSRNDRD